MSASKKPCPVDIRFVFDRLSDAALLDRAQLGQLVNKAPSTMKRWDREGKTPRPVLIGGRPRYVVSDIRLWLRGSLSAPCGRPSQRPTLGEAMTLALPSNETPAS
jgi:hypothetical protein